MNVHVSWRVVLQRIDESETAEDDSILTAAGKNNSWSLLEKKGAWVVHQSSGESS